MKKIIDHRPWGNFEQYTHNETTTVKIITVKPNEPLSYQYHNNRDEFWKILEGGGKVILNDETFETKPGDEFFIKRGTKHRAIGPLKFLEISYGNFNENDIVRVEDKYKRNQ
ncbi:MAG: phosphomannose isomerase type II C-terminal cupin domain [archaeon]